MSNPFDNALPFEQHNEKKQLTGKFIEELDYAGFRGRNYTSDDEAFSHIQNIINETRPTTRDEEIAGAFRNAFIEAIHSGLISIAHFYVEIAERNGLSVQPIENDEKFLAELRACALEHLNRYKVFEAAKVIQKYFPNAKEDPEFMDALKRRTMKRISPSRSNDESDPRLLQDFEQIFDAFHLTPEEREALLRV